MKKLYYESPTVEAVDVRVEGGFGASDFASNGGVTDYSKVDEGTMNPTDSY